MQVLQNWRLVLKIPKKNKKKEDKITSKNIEFSLKLNINFIVDII